MLEEIAWDSQQQVSFQYYGDGVTKKEMLAIPDARRKKKAKGMKIKDIRSKS